LILLFLFFELTKLFQLLFIQFHLCSQLLFKIDFALRKISLQFSNKSFVFF